MKPIATIWRLLNNHSKRKLWVVVWCWRWTDGLESNERICSWNRVLSTWTLFLMRYRLYMVVRRDINDKTVYLEANFWRIKVTERQTVKSEAKTNPPCTNPSSCKKNSKVLAPNRPGLSYKLASTQSNHTLIFRCIIKKEILKSSWHTNLDVLVQIQRNDPSFWSCSVSTVIPPADEQSYHIYSCLTSELPLNFTPKSPRKHWRRGALSMKEFHLKVFYDEPACLFPCDLSHRGKGEPRHRCYLSRQNGGYNRRVLNWLASLRPILLGILPVSLIQRTHPNGCKWKTR